jgi:Lon protease-like protein
VSATPAQEVPTSLELPVFPLPKLVLFPGTLLPLHIFEQRYRDMLADALAGEQRLIAVAQLKPGWESLYEGRPAIYDVAGVGRIAQHVKKADGTYDIVLEARARVRLHELEPHGVSYRRARATRLQEHSPQGGVSPSEVSALLSIATRVASVVKRALPGFVMQAEHDDTPSLLSDRIADQFVLDPAARQDLLETLDVGRRIRSLTLQLAQLHLALSSNDSGGQGTPTLH